MDDAAKLDALRKGRDPDAPTLPGWARDYDDDLRAILQRHVWKTRLPTYTRDWREWDDVAELCRTVHEQRDMLRSAGVWPGVMVEDGDNALD